ncbi:MAG: galE [Frankiales bacterium]|nr:galE [Frankiales bacterium]
MVTGGAGYIGSVVSATLLAAGHEVTVLDDLSTGHRDAVPAAAHFAPTSITRAEPVLRDNGIEAVVHCAAKSLVAESVQSPQLYWDNNVGGSLALLEAMRAAGVRRIVFSSTAAVYGQAAEVPILESAAAAPSNPYGASKLAVDHMLTSYAVAYGFSAVSLRYFNVAGALLSPDVQLGERHATETHLIPIALQVVAGERPELAIYWTAYPTPDGTCVRDYIHVRDLAEAHLRALDWTGTAGAEHLVCNLGSGQGNSVREVLDAVQAVTGTAPAVREAPNRAGDPAVLIASNTRARAVLGWSPTRSLNEMVGDAWRFSRA